MGSHPSQPTTSLFFSLLYRQKLDGPYDSRVLPVVLTIVLMTFLTIVWIGAIISYREPEKRDP
jgi:predicted permease